MPTREFTVCKCGRRSSSLTQVHCVTCHRQFSGMRAFDLHRKVIPAARGGDGDNCECVDPASLRQKSGLPALYADNTGTYGCTVWRHLRSEPQTDMPLAVSRGGVPAP